MPTFALRLLRFAPPCCGARVVLVLALAAWSCAGRARTGHAQLVVAHRGASYDAPENTLAAIQLAWELNADAVEGDFYLTRDRQIVCIHDATTNRTGNRNLDVAESSLSELRGVDVGAWKSQQFAGQRILTLPQVLAAAPSDKRLFIEIKCGPEIAPLLANTLQTYGVAPEQAVIISFNAEVVAAVKRLMPEREAYWIVDFQQDESTGKWTPGGEKVIAQASRIGADGVDFGGKPEVVTKELVKRCRDAGLSVHVWTIDDPAQAVQWQALGVDSVTTNRPDVIRRALEAAESRPALQTPAVVGAGAGLSTPGPESVGR